jgi:signal transduction histidine kinase
MSETLQKPRPEPADLPRNSAEQRHTRLSTDIGVILNGSTDFLTSLGHVARLLTMRLADGCFIDYSEDDWTFRRAAVALANPECNGLVEDLTLRYSTEYSLPLGSGNVLRTGVPEIYPALNLDSLPGKRDAEFTRITQALGARSLIVAPIESRNRIVGAITLISTQPTRLLGANELAQLTELTPLIGLAIENEVLRHAAQRDRAHAESISLYKDEFLGMISHELRTPLQSIMGWTQLLRENKLNRSATNRALESLERNVKAQAQIINDLLDVSHIGTGQLKLDIKPTELRPVIQTALDNLTLSIKAKRLELNFVCPPHSQPTVVNGDSEWLQRVVWNLISNAIKFTPEGGRIDVELKHEDLSASIRICDTGKGIAAEFLPHIFERFRQKDSSVTRQYGGLGIGLTIVRHITEAHGGSIQAESSGENQGSCFTVRLPLTEQRPASGARISQRTDQQLFFAPTLNGLRVLVVEDEADTRDLIAMVLEQGGAKVTLSADAAEGFKQIRRGKHDVLVSDIGMPGEDGVSFIRRVRTLSPSQGGRIPALALTAFARAEDRIQALAAGYQMYIPKPVEPDELILSIGSLATRVV